MDPRREVVHAAVAAGGASAALMSAGIVGTDQEVAGASRECLEPLLRAAILLINASAGMRGCHERERLKVAMEDYLALLPDGPTISLEQSS